MCLFLLFVSGVLWLVMYCLDCDDYLVWGVWCVWQFGLLCLLFWVVIGVVLCMFDFVDLLLRGVVLGCYGVLVWVFVGF